MFLIVCLICVQDRPLDELIDQLGADTYKARQAAAAEIYRQGDRHLPALREALQEADVHRRDEIARLIQQIEPFAARRSVLEQAGFKRGSVGMESVLRECGHVLDRYIAGRAKAEATYKAFVAARRERLAAVRQARLVVDRMDTLDSQSGRRHAYQQLEQASTCYSKAWRESGDLENRLFKAVELWIVKTMRLVNCFYAWADAHSKQGMPEWKKLGPGPGFERWEGAWDCTGKWSPDHDDTGFFRRRRYELLDVEGWFGDRPVGAVNGKGRSVPDPGGDLQKEACDLYRRASNAGLLPSISESLVKRMHGKVSARVQARCLRAVAREPDAIQKQVPAIFKTMAGKKPSLQEEYFKRSFGVLRIRWWLAKRKACNYLKNGGLREGLREVLEPITRSITIQVKDRVVKYPRWDLPVKKWLDRLCEQEGLKYAIEGNTIRIGIADSDRQQGR